MRVREGCAASNRGDRQVGRKQVGSHPDAVLDVQASLARQRNVREYADAEVNELCWEASAVCRLHVINCSIAAMNARESLPEVEPYTPRLVRPSEHARRLNRYGPWQWSCGELQHAPVTAERAPDGC